MGTTNRVQATYLIKNSTAEIWTTRNPVLLQGEYGLENDTFLLKVGDGVRDWNHLPYLNKLDASYFQRLPDGSLTFSDSFQATIAALEAAAGQAIENLQITEPPVDPYDVPNKQYVDDAIAAAGHMHRETVQELPPLAEGDETVIYMVPLANGEGYEEYMFINGAYDMVGVTNSGQQYELPVATTSRLGGVKASVDPDRINVTQEGFMTLNDVSTSLLYVPVGDELILYGGNP